MNSYVSKLYVHFSIKLGFLIIVFAGVWMNSYGSTLHLQFSIKLGYRFCRGLMPFLATRIWTKEATRKPRKPRNQGSHTDRPEHPDLSVLSVAGRAPKCQKKNKNQKINKEIRSGWTLTKDYIHMDSLCFINVKKIERKGFRIKFRF